MPRRRGKDNVRHKKPSSGTQFEQQPNEAVASSRSRPANPVGRKDKRRQLDADMHVVYGEYGSDKRRR